MARLEHLERTGDDLAWITAFASYLDDRPNLEPVIFDLLKRGDWDKKTLRRAGELTASYFEDASGQIPNVRAAWVYQNSGYVVFEGSSRQTIRFQLPAQVVNTVLQPNAGGGGGAQKPPNGYIAVDEVPEPQKRSIPGGGSTIPPSGGFGRLGTSLLYATISIVGAEDAAAAYRGFVQQQLETHSTTNMLLYDVRLRADGVDIVLPREAATRAIVDARQEPPDSVPLIHLSGAELTALSAGKQLPDSHPLRILGQSMQERALVQYTSPFAIRPGAMKDRASKATFALQRLASEARVYRDPLSERTNGLVATLNARDLGASRDYVAVIADDSFKVDDRRIIASIERELSERGIQIIKLSDSTAIDGLRGAGRNVIVITGHADKELAAFVEELGKRGVLEGNFVIFNSCGTALTRSLSERMVQKHGAEAVFVFEDRIEPAPVEDMLVELAKHVAESKKVRLVDELRGIVGRSKLNGVWTICKSWVTSWKGQYA